MLYVYAGLNHRVTGAATGTMLSSPPQCLWQLMMAARFCATEIGLSADFFAGSVSAVPLAVSRDHRARGLAATGTVLDRASTRLPGRHRRDLRWTFRFTDEAQRWRSVLEPVNAITDRSVGV